VTSRIQSQSKEEKEISLTSIISSSSIPTTSVQSVSLLFDSSSLLSNCIHSPNPDLRRCHAVKVKQRGERGRDGERKKKSQMVRWVPSVVREGEMVDEVWIRCSCSCCLCQPVFLLQFQLLQLFLLLRFLFSSLFVCVFLFFSDLI